MPEPTLKEIEQMNVDPEIATGQPAVVYDNSQLLNILNQNAMFKAQNDWAKYNKFLDDYQERLKTRNDIAGLEIADSDRDYLNRQSIDLFKTAFDNPMAIYSPEFNNKLAKIKSEAVSSKTARDFAEKNLQYIYLHPELNTEENKQMIKDYLDVQTIEKGGRKIPLLNLPDVFNMQQYFTGIKELTKETINAGGLSPDEQYFIERLDTKYKYKPYIELLKSSFETDPKIRNKAKKDFDELPENIKSNFEDAKDYWVNLGSKYFGAYDDIVIPGKENITANPNYDKKRHSKAMEAIAKEKNIIKWAELNKPSENQTEVEKAGKGRIKDLLSAVNPLNYKDIGKNGFIDINNIPPSARNITGILYKDGKPYIGELLPKEKKLPNGTVVKFYDVVYFGSGGKQINGIKDIPEYEEIYKEFKSKGYGGWNTFLKSLASAGKLAPQLEGAEGTGTINSIMEGVRFEAARFGKKGFENIYTETEE
jgi:hypothetical protein